MGETLRFKAHIHSVHAQEQGPDQMHVTFAGDGFAVITSDLFAGSDMTPTAGSGVILEEERGRIVKGILPLAGPEV